MSHGARLPVADAGLELRLIHIDDVPESVLHPRSPEEHNRIIRFRFMHHRRRYLMGRFMIRQMLADWSGIAADALRFGEIGIGKPVLLDTPDIYFNLSYADNAVLIGVTRRGSLGVDVEDRRHLPDARDLAENIFDMPERLALRDKLCGVSESDLFLSGWTRKEACLKAAGTGLSLDPVGVSTGLELTRRKVQMADTLQVQVETMIVGTRIMSWATTI
ncbi:4'-phosphopantetheinyl transferase family protein [Sphingobium lactosutens]|uniref:4'-phosphopantetheinyl transferase family protein n=1 Tax=Sphingobium lactosutens TaxID=522773 RepID=UPI0015BFBCF1|nr:4'-phosphopantetheinyl transferase superfamily protein [Sphingobium lactosutens]